MRGGSWSSYQSAFPPEAHAGGERDDDCDERPVEIVSVPCPGCGKPNRVPVDAEGDDLCCSKECVAVVCRQMDADIAAMQEADRQEWEARLVDGPCAKCGKPCRSLPPDFETGCAFCSKECERARAAELWGGSDSTPGGDLPL